MKAILETEDLVKYYGEGENQVRTIDHTSMQVQHGEFVAVVGRSGSGKSTLLHMLGGLVRPDSGKVYIEGRDIFDLKDEQLAVFRRRKIGFIFQDYNLLDTMSLQDNIALPLSLNGVPASECIQRTRQMGAMFGLKEHLEKYPYQLSGGQKQRGAACRALITNPKILFADEPTGALDSRSSKELLECLRTVNEKEKAAILMVTHDAFTASYAKEVYILSDGVIKCKINRGKDRKEFYDRIIDMQVSMGGDFS